MQEQALCGIAKAPITLFESFGVKSWEAVLLYLEAPTSTENELTKTILQVFPDELCSPGEISLHPVLLDFLVEVEFLSVFNRSYLSRKIWAQVSKSACGLSMYASTKCL